MAIQELKLKICLFQERYSKVLNLVFSIILLIYPSLVLFSAKKIDTVDILLIYPCLHIIILFMKLKKIDNNFTGPHKKRVIIDFIKNSKLSYCFLFFTVFSWSFFIYEKTYLNITKTLLLLFISTALEIKFIKRIDFKVFTIIKEYSLPLFFMLCSIIFFWLGSIILEKGIYSTIATNTLSTISDIAILNIATTFILLQMNYSKYGSSYLIIKTLKSPVLILLAFFPALVILFNVYIIKNNDTISYLPTFLLILSFFSSIGLFALLRNVLETSSLLNDLFLEIRKEDITNYKKNIIYGKEPKIDSVLTIITNTVSKNGSIASHSLFFYLSGWVRENINEINGNDITYQDISNNKFYDFFETIINCIINSNNRIIHMNFLYSIREMLFRDINHENYLNFKIIYKMLFKYLTLMLERDTDEICKYIYQVIYKDSSKVLLNLPAAPFEGSISGAYDRTIIDFENIFTKDLYMIVDLAIKNKNIKFLKSMNIYNTLFILRYDQKEESFKKWDDKIFGIFLRTRNYISMKNKFLIDNGESYFNIDAEYEIFLNYFYSSDDDTSCEDIESFKKAFYDSFLSIYTSSISSGKIKSVGDFTIIYMHIFETISNNNFKEFEIYLTIFTFLINMIFEKEFSNKKHNISLIKSVWMKFVQIKDQKEIETNKAEFKSMIDAKYTFFHNRYKELVQIEKLKYNYRFIGDLNIIDELNIEKNDKLPTTPKMSKKIRPKRKR